MSHPLHLHGWRFRVLEPDGSPAPTHGPGTGGWGRTVTGRG